VRFETAGERIVDACRRTAEQGGGPRYVLYKNNSDGKGNSYGYHENYSVPRRVPVQRLVEGLMPFLVTRMIFCGAGKVGAENGRPGAPYQISQRADFFEALVELNTMVRRPLFNTRDEPHADPAAWMRLHVIPADSNMAQVSTFLKAGTMALVLRLIEDEAVGEPPRLKAPLQALSAVSRDLTLGPNVEVEGGAALTPVQVQRHYLERVKAHFAVQDLPGSFPEVVRRWEAVLDALERDPMSLERELDWVIKYRMIETYLRHKGLDWDSPRTRAMDLQYHDLDPAKGLYHTLGARGLVEELVDEPAVAEAVRGAPEDTRAWFRGQCLARFGKAVYGVSWSSVLLTTADGIRRIPTLNPLRGTRAITAPLFEGCDDPEALVARLEAGG